MEHPQYYAPYRIADSSSLGFPLGTAFLLVAVFSLSGIFSCYYHWHRIRLLRRRADLEAGNDLASFKSKFNYDMSEKQNQSPNMPAVLMPGDEVPKFIALPCPCKPPRPEKVAEEVQLPRSPSPSPPPPKPIRMVVGLLL